MKLLNKVQAVNIGLVLVSLVALTYIQVVVWKETVSWTTDIILNLIQEDNSFFQ